jgi:serine/threonine protein kinase
MRIKELIVYMNFNQTKMYINLNYYSLIIIKILGTGTYGSVIKAIDKRTKLPRAIKVIPKNRVRN